MNNRSLENRITRVMNGGEDDIELILDILEQVGNFAYDDFVFTSLRRTRDELKSYRAKSKGKVDFDSLAIEAMTHGVGIMQRKGFFDKRRCIVEIKSE